MKLICDVGFPIKLALIFLILGLILGVAMVLSAYPVESSPSLRPTASASLCQPSR
jgi:hypothetical protein